MMLLDKASNKLDKTKYKIWVKEASIYLREKQQRWIYDEVIIRLNIKSFSILLFALLVFLIALHAYLALWFNDFIKVLLIGLIQAIKWNIWVHLVFLWSLKSWNLIVWQSKLFQILRINSHPLAFLSRVDKWWTRCLNSKWIKRRLKWASLKLTDAVWIRL